MSDQTNRRSAPAKRADLRFVPLDDLMPLIRESLAAGQDVRFYPRGISMLPMLRQGTDSVMLSPVRGPLKRYDIPLYQREDGSYVLHRVVDVHGGTPGAAIACEDAQSNGGDAAAGPFATLVYDCCGDHQFAIERGIRHSQVIAVVSGFYRADHYVPLMHPRYRRYCRILHHSRGLRHFRWKCIGAARRMKRKLLGGK